MPILGHAAGFDCAKAVSATEKAICADSTISALDSKMATAWAKARARSSDSAALTKQRQWIAQRDACGSDGACLKRRYQQRLAELLPTAASDHAASHAAPRLQQRWKLDVANESVGSDLTITGTSSLHFTIQAFNGGNTGDLDGEATRISDTQARYEKPGCRIDFNLHGGKLVVDEKESDTDGGCGAGAGVSFAGHYVTASEYAKKPAPNLHSLGVVSSTAEDATIRNLLGKDYPTLLSAVNLRATDAAMGTAVTTLWVRGLANTNAAIVMNHEGRDFWIGLLVFDAHDQVRMRYYTTVVQDKKTLPKPIRDWHDQIDKTLPIDMMP